MSISNNASNDRGRDRLLAILSEARVENQQAERAVDLAKERARKAREALASAESALRQFEGKDPA